MIRIRNRKLAIGDRVYCEFNPSKASKKTMHNYKGVIVAEGYNPDQWRVLPDGKDKPEMIHESFISAIREMDKAA